MSSYFTHWGESLKSITATNLARNLRRILDQLASEGEGIVIERNRQPVARLLPGPSRQSALEAMADLYRTIPDDAAATWEADGRKGRWKGSRLEKGIRDPWASYSCLASYLSQYQPTISSDEL
jgi:antitoxin (DNA-binding transcriptional repressor) of toxin-antitoxin stability system